ncbi:MAG: DUF374 domain-containing protein [Gemmatimonadetes bacterium]|nr:MAG: DUF374 domain-containing protein [Gemmatimonadota bacterium]
MKSIKNTLLLILAEYLGAGLIYLLGRTLRITWVDEAKRTSIPSPVLYAFWHSRMLILGFSHRFRQALILISESQDGEFIARPIHRLGFVPVRGSTSRSGLKALFRMARLISAGQDGAITPDGPRGPRQQVQIGTVLIAQRAGVPVLPIIAAAEKCWQLNSWDRFMIPKPFSRAVIIHGNPINIPRKCTETELEAKRQAVERELNRITDLADHYWD